MHLALFPKPEEIFADDPAPVLDEWKKLFEIRDAALRKLEQERQTKRIGKGLEADVLIEASGEALSLLQQGHTLSGLKEFLNVSGVRVKEYEYTDPVPQVRESEVILPSLGGHIEISALPASGHKCARCWNYMPVVADYGAWHDVCTRCHDALEEMGVAKPEAAS